MSYTSRKVKKVTSEAIIIGAFPGGLATVISGLQKAQMVMSLEGVKEPLADIGIEDGVTV